MCTVKFLPIAALALLAAACPSLRAADGGEASEKEPAPVLKADDPKWKLDFSAVEMIALQDDGRKKPLQTYAFEAIEQICGRPLIGSTFITLPTGEPGGGTDNPKSVKFNAMDLYLSLWFHPEFWQDKPVILCKNPQLRALIYSGKKPKYEDEKRIAIIDLMENKSFRELLESIGKKSKDAELTGVETEAKLVYLRAQMVMRIRMSDEQLALLPHWSKLTGSWLPLNEFRTYVSSSLKEGAKEDLPDRAQKTVDAYKAFRSAYEERAPERFAKASFDFRQSLEALSPAVYPPVEALGREINYNNVRPFAWAWMFYLGAGLLTLVALKSKGRTLYYSALAMYVLGFGLHVYGFALRCLIAGRPPVSNMYESVIWVGSGVVFFGLIFELKSHKMLYMLSGAFTGFGCLVLMDLVPVVMGDPDLPGFDPKIKPLLPVLRDNFWLTVHVLSITLSYAAFMLAWGMGHISLWSHLTRPAQRVEHGELHQLVYRVMQVGVLLLATGTILGGVWAYYSWGRFWGWDPKETWAFIALMCYIVVLHGRFAGLWTNFGLAFGSVFCFQAVVMAWYGVNFVLNTGLHSYGAGADKFRGYVLGAVVVDMVFLAVATAQYLRYKNKNLPPPDDGGDGSAAENASGPGAGSSGGKSSSKDPLVKFG